MLKKSNRFSLPHFNERPPNSNIDTIVIHYTEKKDIITWYNEALEIGVSAHYLISKQGEIYSVVSDNFRAWHAGESFWRGRNNVNDFSIGIELDNNGKEPFSNLLMHTLSQLCHELISIYPINKFNIVGHSDVAPSRKADPGKFFDWNFLAQNNIGIMPPILLEAGIKNITTIQRMLADYGYKIDISGIKDQQTINVMKAFNMHFNQNCKEEWNKNSQGILEYLLKY